MSLHIGLIGVGGLGFLQAKTYRELEEITIVGAADVSSQARDLFEREFHAPAYDNYRALLHEHADELDAMTIVTPHTLHYEQTMACLEEGLHVLVEKPMVTDVGNAVDLIETAAERDLVIQVGYQRHFHPAFREIRRVIRDGRIGDLHAINCFVGQNWIDNHRDNWRTNPELSGGGQLYDTGSHLLDVVLWLTDATPQTVSAQMEFAKPDIDVNSALSVDLRRDGRSITAGLTICGNGVRVVPSEGYFCWGSAGQISYQGDLLVIDERDAPTYSTEITTDYDFNHLNEQKLQNFVDSIEGTAEPAVPASVGLEVTALTEAAYDANDRGTRVDVQPVIDDAQAKRT